MKLIFQFNDGTKFIETVDDDYEEVRGDTELVDAVMNGQKENRRLSLQTSDGDEVHRKYKDLKRIEIAFDDPSKKLRRKG
ncbi:hypothetical protein [Alkalicoccus chagannorensis]|uniref:hypothetical protein n=1 Tax=Alkalicoccus chagannorensis TaxID=427072 RepID=UPI0004119063|nr:hypothetical protein [Alkalicoccus chagannorensis]